MTAALALVRDLPEPGGPGSRTVNYGRQSKGKKVSIARQLRLGAARAEQRGWQVAATLDDKISASRNARKQRTGWPQVFGLIRAGQVDIVQVWETSRADRKGSTWHLFLELCEDHGVLIWVESKKRLYDVRDEDDMDTMASQGAANRRESAFAKRRTCESKDDARALGDLREVLGGPPPVGYRMGEDDDGEPWWVPDPDQVKLLRGVAARVLAGETLRAAYTAETGALGEVRTAPSPNRPDGLVITEKMIRAALTRPVTAGMMMNRDGTEDRVVVDDPPLDERTWRRLRVDFAGRRRRRPSADYPFSRILACGRCGNQLTGSPVYYRGEKIPAYGCANPHPGHPQPCGGVTIRAGLLHPALRAAAERWAHNVPEVGAEQAAIDARRAELDDGLARAKEALADLHADRAALPVARYKTLRADARREADRVQAELDSLSRAELERPAVRPAVEWDGMTGPERCRLIERTFETPIVVAPAARRGPGQSVLDRITLTPTVSE